MCVPPWCVEEGAHVEQGKGCRGYHCRQRASVSWTTSSQRCGVWHLPRFPFREGLLTLMHMASFMVLVKPWDSLSTMEKFYGVPKIHQRRHPLGTIVSIMCSIPYDLAKELAIILTTGRRLSPMTPGIASTLGSRSSPANFNWGNVCPPMMWKPAHISSGRPCP